MPTSPYSTIPCIVNFLALTKPSSILDIGLGNGKLGFIARDYLDVMLGERYRREEWKIVIDGIEVFPDYIQDHQKAIYNSIYIGDAHEVIDGLGSYDLIMLGDVLEHFEKDRAWQFLRKCIRHSNQFLIVCIPLGEGWAQPEIYGNCYEKHLSFWTHEDFEPFVCKEQLLKFPNLGDYGAFLIRKEDYMLHEVRERADALFADGRKDEAISDLSAVLEGLAPDLSGEYLLVDMLVRTHRISEAIERLRRMESAFPNEKMIRHFLARLAPERER